MVAIFFAAIPSLLNAELLAGRNTQSPIEERESEERENEEESLKSAFRQHRRNCRKSNVRWIVGHETQKNDIADHLRPCRWSSHSGHSLLNGLSAPLRC